MDFTENFEETCVGVGVQKKKKNNIIIMIILLTIEFNSIE
jgi:hypothetical protein